MLVWEIIFIVVVLKIPVAYIGSVVWWAIKAEPEIGSDGGSDGIGWRPWRRRPPGSARPARGVSRGGPAQTGSRIGRRGSRRASHHVSKGRG